jgi:uncharacterized membrane protein
MSKSARSLFVFSIYLFVLGIVLLVIPNVLLNLLALPETNEVWIRVVGMLVFILGFYYFQAAKSEIKKFFQWTVYGRTAVLIFFIVFVILDYTPPILILFGFIDAVAALWTQLSLRSEKQV